MYAAKSQKIQGIEPQMRVNFGYESASLIGGRDPQTNDFDSQQSRTRYSVNRGKTEFPLAVRCQCFGVDAGDARRYKNGDGAKSGDGRT